MFARTERLLLRPAWREDAPALRETIDDEAIARNLASVPWPYGEQDAQAFIDAPRDPRHPDLLIFTRTHGAPRLVGGIGLKPGDNDAVELGYWIARPLWGLGFATEAGRAVIALAHHSLRIARLTAGHFVDNPASGRVLRKLGFRPTGEIVHRHSAGRGRVAACALFAREVHVGRAMDRALAA